MAQQTINVGAAPNDGTGTPLRTAFQYTNSNFSELYTAVGPSGNNITVPGTATITGDLTVKTNVLKVDTTNNRVGIGTASPGCNLEVYSSSANELRVSTITAGDVRLGMSVIGTTYNWIDSLRSGGAMVFGVGNAEHYRITSGGTFTWSDGGGGTRMTLNSTGLGVGGSPNDKLEVVGSGGAGIRVSRAGVLSQYTTLSAGATGPSLDASSAIGALTFGIGGSTKMTLDSSGNVGIGVTPSGSGGCLQLKSGITFPATQVASSDANTLDDYEEGTWTPTVSAETGTLTAYTVISANYTKIGRLVSTTFDIRIDTAGTGTAGLKVSLPFSPSVGGQTCGAGREYINTGKMCQVPKFDATNAVVYFYDNGTVIANTNRVMCSYTYFV